MTQDQLTLLQHAQATMPGHDVGLLKQTLRRLLQVEPIGSFTNHMREIIGLPPEVMRIDQVSLAASINAQGAITQPQLVSLSSEYTAELFAICGFQQVTQGGAALAPLVSFNIREDGRNFDFFSTPVEMAYYVSPTTGAGNVIQYPRGAYVFRPGARIKLTYHVAPAYRQLAAGDVRWGVLLLLNLIRHK